MTLVVGAPPRNVVAAFGPAAHFMIEPRGSDRRARPRASKLKLVTDRQQASKCGVPRAARDRPGLLGNGPRPQRAGRHFDEDGFYKAGGRRALLPTRLEPAKGILFERAAWPLRTSSSPPAHLGRRGRAPCRSARRRPRRRCRNAIIRRPRTANGSGCWRWLNAAGCRQARRL